MPKKDYFKIKKKDNQTFELVRALKIVNDFEDELDIISDQRCFLKVADPNSKYLLHISDMGFDKVEDVVYTDGIVTELDNKLDSKNIEVKDASYVFLATEHNGEIEEGWVYTKAINIGFYDFLVMDITDILNKRKNGYIESATKPRVLKRKTH